MKTFKLLSLSLLFALPLAAGAAPRPATPFTDAELDAMLAPVALYPDTVLSHVLIAATVPEDVEEAADWLDHHPGVKGQAAVDAVEGKDWDPSVKALVAFPEVIERLDEDPDWTADLGDAFLDQEDDVMDRVQALRDRAYENGSLDRMEHVRVVREREYIYLEPAVDYVYYVPYYDPWYVYGAWWWASYPPHRWAYWGGYPVHHYSGASFYWGVSYHVGPTWYASSFNWPRHQVVVSREHRRYSPQGYSGGSNTRHPHVAGGGSGPGGGGAGGGGHPDHPTHPTHPTHPEHPDHPDHPAHPEHPDHPDHPAHPNRPAVRAQRDASEVRAGLAARREQGRGMRGNSWRENGGRVDRDASPRSGSRGSGERIVRDDSRGRSWRNEQRADRGVSEREFERARLPRDSRGAERSVERSNRSYERESRSVGHESRSVERESRSVERPQRSFERPERSERAPSSRSFERSAPAPHGRAQGGPSQGRGQLKRWER